ncbi:MarR family winged helix-turn-helix transcriptional regulator [Stakelama saccharophila]|uniref:MarR family transcriptional regulator n=1 Tax=Stakelama saccharophila TaxID=3075605 RepID=A0ABZ0B740_9SPHN|nr:MarR family transcriptional regulator [Stakelama sp. W311]WNO53226.1 MarR family transcriptional regulator [Stakelama sp. W311]
MADMVNMAGQSPNEPLRGASPLFLREPEIRRGVELLFFGYSHLTRAIDERLAAEHLGRAHHRALYFIARQPDLTVSDLLATLAITKQSLGRVLNDLSERGLVESRTGERDRRQKLLRLTEAGKAIEAELFESLRERLSAAYSKAGQDAVGGFWLVLEGLLPEAERQRIAGAR